MKKQIKGWLMGDESMRPEIVTLPIEEDPDKLVLQVETDDGRQKGLHPGMIADMALAIDLTDQVKPGDIASANAAVANLCADHRPILAT